MERFLSWRKTAKSPVSVSVCVVLLVVVTAVALHSLFRNESSSSNNNSRYRSTLTTEQTGFGTTKSIKTREECEQRAKQLCVAVSHEENGTTYYCGESVLKRNCEILLSNEKDALSKVFCPTCKLSFGVTPYNPGDAVPRNLMYNSYVYKKLGGELTEQCQQLGTDVEIVPYFSFFPGEQNSVEKGFLIRSSIETSETLRSFVANIAKKYGQSKYFEYEVEGDRVNQKLIAVTEGSHDSRLICSSTLVQVMPPECHPLFTHTTLHPVFQDMAKVRMALSEAYKLKMEFAAGEIEDLLDIGINTSVLSETWQPPRATNPVIAIEGLDGTGKTTLCKKLSTSINATLLHSPPECIFHLRYSFDAHPPLLRRAYYSLGNYIMAQEIAEAAKLGPVVLDRFWHSSAAYAIASEVGCGDSTNLPPVGHEIYKWPQDLLEPDVVLFLTVSPEERQKRINSRSREGVKVTKDERWIEKSRHFHERLSSSYQRMIDPAPVIVDASGTPEQVLEAVRDVLKTKKLLPS